MTGIAISEMFDIPAGVTYLNCANMAPQLRSVTAAGLDAVRKKAAPWTLSSSDWFTGAEELRMLAGRVMGAEANDIALVPAASYGIAVAANNVAVNPSSSWKGSSRLTFMPGGSSRRDRKGGCSRSGGMQKVVGSRLCCRRSMARQRSYRFLNVIGRTAALSI